MDRDELSTYKIKFMQEDLNRQEIATLIVGLEDALTELEALKRTTWVTTMDE